MRSRRLAGRCPGPRRPATETDGVRAAPLMRRVMGFSLCRVLHKTRVLISSAVQPQFELKHPTTITMMKKKACAHAHSILAPLLLCSLALVARCPPATVAAVVAASVDSAGTLCY